MSHAATKWAFDQPELHRDMKPSEWAVLMVLADCHNPVNGCFPSQDYICQKTNLAERAVRDQLARLRERGLVDWDAVRDGQRRGSNRYRLGFEPDFQPANSAGREDAVSTGEIVQSQPADSDALNRQNLPPNPVREPVKEPEREGAGARADENSDDPAKFEKRVKKLAADLDWPGWANSSTAWSVAQFAKLTDAERTEAERLAQAYRSMTGRKALSLGTYFAERKWTDVPDPAETPPEPLAVPPFGPVWSGMRMRKLLSPAEPSPAPTSAFIAQLIAQDDAAGRAERMRRQVQFGWPAVNRMHEAAEQRRGVTVAPELEWIGGLTEFVPIGTETWEAWRVEHELRGWPWLPDPGGMRGAYFPKGGPLGLAEFEAAVKTGDEETQNDGGRSRAA